MKLSLQKNKKKMPGFTFIEAMIVVAIAGLIMVIVLVAVHDVGASRRDTTRKDYAGRLLDAINEFYKNNGRYPDCIEVPLSIADPGCGSQTGKDIGVDFLTHYMPEGVEPSTGVKYNSATSAASVNTYTNLTATSPCTHGVSTGPNNLVIYCYDINDVEHNFKTITPGQISIGFGHWCYASNPDGANTVIAGDDKDKTRAVILIGLERGGYYCIDNYAGR